MNMTEYTFTVSKNSFTEYYPLMNDYDKIAYMDLLFLLSGGESTLDINGSIESSNLKKLKLLTKDKVRVFNFKRPKRKVELPREVHYLQALWQAGNGDDKFFFGDGKQVGAFKYLVKNYSLDILEKIIYIYLPIGNKEMYVKKINTPLDLMYNIKTYASGLERAGVFDTHKEEIIEKVKELKNKRTVFFGVITPTVDNFHNNGNT